MFSRGLTWLRGSWASTAVTPLVCKETVAELLRVLAYKKFKLDQTWQKDLLGHYLPYAQSIKLPDPLPVLPVTCRDPDDNIFLHLALTSKADFLVSGDNDLLELHGNLPCRL